MALSILGLFAAIAFSLAFYPYTPRPAIVLCLLALLLIVASLVRLIYAGLSRDETVSHITNTEPGALGWDFWTRIAGFIEVPLIGLFTAQFRLGVIGANDDTMGESVPPGSVVVIDKSDNTVEMGGWTSIRERPIYFVWHENGFSCCWCYMARETLFIVPYPTSHQPVMIFKTPRAASIIGRVIHVWPPLIIQKPS
jgi:hypothetical protein